jgi:xanthine dehydrogenase accessory factor
MNPAVEQLILIRGGGDLASGVALRLWRCGLPVVITELEEPLVVRRMVSFAEAVYEGHSSVEGVVGQRIGQPEQAWAVLATGQIPVLVDAELDCLSILRPIALVDGRMTKQAPQPGYPADVFAIGLGPGFSAGENCQAVIETQRGHLMGRVIWRGAALPDTGIPESLDGGMSGERINRILRSPADGTLRTFTVIGEHLEAGQAVAEVAGQAILAPTTGVLRGIIRPGVRVWQGLKIGDVDPRNDPASCFLVSDKALAVGGGVLEALLTRPEMRQRMVWR